MDRKNYYALDIAKFISALLVICIHTGPLLDVDQNANFIVVQIIARIAVPFFFIVSGFLFFQKIDFRREWNDYENIAKLKHYVGRLFKIYVIWSILYLPFNYWILHTGDGLTWMAFATYIRDFFFTGSFYHLWFLPALMFAVCAVYFMISTLSMRKTLIITMILYVIGMFGNVYPKLLDTLPVIHLMWKSYASIFVTTRNGLFFGMVFIALGAYFAKKTMYLKRPFLVIGLILSFILLLVECFTIRKHGFMSDLASMYFMLMPCVSFLFLLLLRIPLSSHKIYKTLRKLSLLIYVSHIMFVSILLWTMPELHSLVLYALSLMGSIILSIFILWLSSKLHILKALY